MRRLSLQGAAVWAQWAPAVVGTELTPSVPAGRWESRSTGIAAPSPQGSPATGGKSVGPPVFRTAQHMG